MKRLAPLLCLALLLPFAAAAQTKPQRADFGGEPPQSILWVGNSFFYYNNSMHTHLLRLVAAADPKSRARGNTYVAGIDRDTAAFLQTVAWEAVREYFGK